MYDYNGNNWRQWNSNKSLKKNLEALPRKPSIDSLQRTAILETSHIIRKVQQSETRSVIGGDHCWFRRNTREKPSVTGDNGTIVSILISHLLMC
jgi:hypothetical protein